MSLAGKHITVGLTGGIACYKTASLIRLLVKAGCDVRAIMTEAATKFITPLTMETVTQNPVAVEMFPVDSFVATRHIDFADWADMMVIAPATANFLGKIASGISDDLLTTVVCATSKPILICPAMNPNMWNNPVTRRNCKELSDLGYLFEGPVEGEMACDHVGVGRLAEPETILAAIEAYLESTPKKKELVGKHIVVTAGPCREAIDPVRFISNRSSGRMGYALAEAAIKMGAQVTLISGPSALSAPVGAEYVPVESTEQMCHAVEDSMSAADCLIMAAAPADFRPAEPATNKIKKSGSAMDLRLMPTVDILQQVTRNRRPGQIVVGFALETDNGLAKARKKLVDKALDMIVLNYVGEHTGFDVDTNELSILFASGRQEDLGPAPKAELARKLLEKVASLL